MKNKIIFFVLLAIIFTSCKENQTQEKEDSHSHEDIKLQITSYSNEFELFAEADPFVVGHTSGILSHFSHLPSFKALEKGEVKIRLIVSGNEVSQTLAEPTRKGIYKFRIKPNKAGKGLLIFDIKSNGIKSQITSNIEVFSDEHDAIHSAEDAEISIGDAVPFTKEQSWKVDFATELPLKHEFGQNIKTVAQVQSLQRDEILISAKTSGIILFSNNIVEGQSVNLGQILCNISGKGLADNNFAVRFAKAQNNFNKAKQDYERQKDLAKDKIISEKELLNAKNKYENTKAIYGNLNKNFSSTGQNLKSLLNGYVKQIFVKNGQFVKIGQPIASISQNQILLLRAEVQQKYASVLNKITSATILLNNKTYTLEELNGKILSFGKSVSSDNYLIPISLQIENNGRFINGGFIELYLKTLTNSKALTIPNSALLENQGNYFVYVQVNPEVFEKREIKIGKTNGFRTEILSGINLKERVVTIGAVLVKLAHATGNLDAHSGHAH